MTFVDDTGGEFSLADACRNQINREISVGAQGVIVEIAQWLGETISVDNVIDCGLYEVVYNLLAMWASTPLYNVHVIDPLQHSLGFVFSVSLRQEKSFIDTVPYTANGYVRLSVIWHTH